MSTVHSSAAPSVRSPSVSQSASHAETALAGVYEISKLLASPNRLERTLAGVLDLLASFMEMHHGLIALLGARGDPEIVVGTGWSEANAKQHFERLPERATGQIVATRMPLVVPDVRTDPLFARADLSGWGPDDRTPYSLIGVPIKDDNNVVGTLTIDRVWTATTQRRFDDDVRFLTMVANLVGQTLRLHKVVARDRERLMAEQRRLEKELSATHAEPVVQQIKGIVGTSPSVFAAIEKARIVAKSNTTVLLRGESGTGKELFATALHNLSPRRDKPFIKLNCAALPESVLESELFGHEKGAFTGAHTQRKGRFELADGGTLFLDEIGEISATFQAKLLRVLQEGEFERVGGSHPVKVDVRLVCATNRNLEDAVSRGEFRADLYYRISVIPILLPALRDRIGDIPPLAREFLRRFNAEHGTERSLTKEAMAVLSNCAFPGNIRELENCVRRTATLAASDAIGEADFACHNDGCLSAILWKGTMQLGPPPTHTMAVAAQPVPIAAPRPAPVEAAAAPACASGSVCPFPAGEQRADRDRLIEAMEMSGWVQAKAARLMGLTTRQLGYALRKHEIPIKKF
jgi:Nif-specific regulatory protein